MKRHPPHYWIIKILLVLLTIFVATKVQFIFQPLIVTFSTLFLPVIISGYLYFITIPLLNLLIKLKIPRMMSILIVVSCLVSVIFFIFYMIIPLVIEQLTSIAGTIPNLVEQIKSLIENFSDTKYYDFLANQTLISVSQIKEKIITLSTTVIDRISSSISDLVKFISRAALVIFLVPFIFFYMLKDGDGLKGAIIRLLPKRASSEAEKILSETYVILGRYIRGQMLDCTFVAVMSALGYFIIGLPYALTFGIFIGIFNIIPYLGPWIGSIPAMAVALYISPTTAILAALVIYVVQLAESNVLAPMIHGRNLKIHPLTVIIVMILAGKLVGILGMLLAIPAYAVVKVVVVNLRRIFFESEAS